MKRNQQGRNLNDILNTGFSPNTNLEGGRLANKDGSVNLIKIGIPFWERISLYHTLLRMGRYPFLAAIFLFYTVLNLFFASIYVALGVESLQGANGSPDGIMNEFLHAFFFSSQTLTTVGYGHISPVGFWANVVASFESFMGILSFALVTGLLYGRFTRPKAFIRFSDNMVIAPHKGRSALMLRLVTYKNNHLTDVEATINVAIHQSENGTRVRRFYPLTLEISRINSLALSWTIVHLIDEESPMYGLTHEEMKERGLEVLIYIRGFDDSFSNVVQQRTSYTASEIVWGAKFQPMFRRSEDGATTILELDKVNLHHAMPLPVSELSEVNA